MSANGGTPVQVTRPDSAHGVTGHRFPVLLPDGRHFLFVSVPFGLDNKGGLCVGSLDGGPTREIGRVESGVVWQAPDWLITTRNAALVAWRFDFHALKMVGDPATIGDPLVGSQYSGGPVVSASAGGTLTFLTRQETPARLEWYDLYAGHPMGTPPLAAGPYTTVNLSPDDRRAIVSEQSEPTRSDIVLVELDRGVTSRLTQAPDNADYAVWSNDGTRVTYVEGASGTVRVRSLIDGSTRAFLADDHAFKRVYGWTPDDRAVLYGRLDAATKWDVWLLPVDGSPPQPCLRSPANELAAQISSDGRWLKYTSDESGATEACVVPFKAPGLKYQVTIGGGDGAFSFDARRFYYALVKDPRAVWAAEVRTQPAFSLGPAKVVFHIPGDQVNWALARDERRILRLVPAEKPAPQAATILENWPAAIRKP